VAGTGLPRTAIHPVPETGGLAAGGNRNGWVAHNWRSLAGDSFTGSFADDFTDGFLDGFLDGLALGGTGDSLQVTPLEATPLNPRNLEKLFDSVHWQLVPTLGSASIGTPI